MTTDRQVDSMTTPLQLGDACTDFNLASADAEHLRERRNALIVQAAESGLTQQQLSEITGLSRGRINQIVKAAPSLVLVS